MATREGEMEPGEKNENEAVRKTKEKGERKKGKGKRRKGKGGVIFFC